MREPTWRGAARPASPPPRRASTATGARPAGQLRLQSVGRRRHDAAQTGRGGGSAVSGSAGCPTGAARSTRCRAAVRRRSRRNEAHGAAAPEANAAAAAAAAAARPAGAAAAVLQARLSRRGAAAAAEQGGVKSAVGDSAVVGARRVCCRGQSVCAPLLLVAGSSRHFGVRGGCVAQRGRGQERAAATAAAGMAAARTAAVTTPAAGMREGSGGVQDRAAGAAHWQRGRRRRALDRR
jgi:hypothetical protein